MAATDFILDRVKELTGAEDARIESWLTPNVVRVKVSHADGPDAYTFRDHFVAVNEDGPRIIGSH